MKKRSHNILISLLFTSFFLSACKKEANAPSADAKKLFGTWEWFDSSGGYSGGGMADSDDNKHTLKFSKDGKITKYEKGIKAGVGTFSFTNKTNHATNGTTQFYIEIKNQRGKRKMDSKQYFVITSDTLYLAPTEISDSYMQHYKKK